MIGKQVIIVYYYLYILRELHLTNIRNENAYFGCISKLLPYHPNLIKPNYKPIYIIGDSHCLSSAWQIISIRVIPF